MPDYLFFDSDSHVLEPPDLWTTRLEKKYRERAPRVVWSPSGMQGECWVVDGIAPFSAVGGGFLGASNDPESYDNWVRTAHFDETRKGAHDPVPRLKDMAKDGIEATVVYPTNAGRFFALSDGPFQTAIFRAYNDWVAEFCSYDRKSLGAVGLISMTDIVEATKELAGARAWASKA